MTARTTPRPPSHLSVEAKRWWTQVVTTYELEPHHLRVLQLAAEAWDRGQGARRALRKFGTTFRDRFGQVKPRPEVGIERDAAITFMRALRELMLDCEPPAESKRSPGIGE